MILLKRDRGYTAKPLSSYSIHRAYWILPVLRYNCTQPDYLFCSCNNTSFFGDYIIYDSLSDLYIFSVVVSILALVYMLILTAIVKGMTHVLTLPAWSAYILEFIFAWAAVYFSIQYVSNHIIENISIFQGGEVLLSLFITFLFSGLDILFTNLDKISKEKLG